MDAAPTEAPTLKRMQALARLRQARRWDLVVVGGGATGLGVALDAAARGLDVLLLEAADFAQGTSSRSTKLVHGGVRYLAQGHVGLVREALRERAALLANAPHLAQPLAFVVPAYRAWELPFYGVGLKAYQWLAGARSLGPTQALGARAVRAALPTAREASLRGGLRYWDGQFDDARLAVALARTAQRCGGTVLNHLPVTGLRLQAGRVAGVSARDAETGEPFEIDCACVVNATGVWVDALRRSAVEDPQPDGSATAAGLPSSRPSTRPSALVSPSQGVHLVVDRHFLPGDEALMVPRTRDGRVLFAVPWLGKTLLGTTDTPRSDIVAEPRPMAQEVDFILGEAARYLSHPPTRSDIRSAWVGLRPLVRLPASGKADGVSPGTQALAPGPATRQLSREHTVEVAGNGLVSVTGGKWTTYRAMAEDVLEVCMTSGLLPHKAPGATERLRLVGAEDGQGAAPARPLSQPEGEHLYGTDQQALRALPGADHWLARDEETGQPTLSEAMVRFAVRHEAARSVEDVLARRSRLLFLDARQAARCADTVAAILAQELGSAFDPVASAQAFKALADQYACVP